MRLKAQTKIDDLIQKYPFLLDFLAGLSPKFAKLKNPVLRKTVGKIASLEQVASFGDMPLAELVQKIKAEVKNKTGEELQIEGGGEKAEPLGEKETRLEVLKDIIRDLHQGGNLEELKRRFAELIKDVRPAEISEMEQRLIEEGMPEEEVKRLCDVHVQVFKDSLEGQPLPSSIPGHPLYTMMAENREAERAVARMKDLLAKADSGEDWEETGREVEKEIERLAEIETHYLRKENQLFPLLEAKGVGGPSKVMWAVHDDIRAKLKEFRRLLGKKKNVQLVPLGQNLLQAISDMIYKEEKILFPMSLETLDENDWARVRKGEEEIGYAWIRPGSEWKPSVSLEELPSLKTSHEPFQDLELDTGALTLEEVNLVLKSLPVDLTFVDENDTVRYYSATAERIFPRSPAVVGRKVQNCHPPASVHMVNRILDAFKKGQRNVAEFWIEMKGKFILIRYFAVRDERGKYRGCLEVSQDVTTIRQLKGEKRLLDWE